MDVDVSGRHHSLFASWFIFTKMWWQSSFSCLCSCGGTHQKTTLRGIIPACTFPLLLGDFWISFRKDYMDKHSIVVLNRNLCSGVCGLQDQSQCQWQRGMALSKGEFIRSCPGTLHHCPSVYPDNVICPLSTEYQMSVMSIEINLMSPEDMQLIFWRFS